MTYKVSSGTLSLYTHYSLLFSVLAARTGSCGSVPGDWSAAPPVVNSTSYTPPARAAGTTSAAQLLTEYQLGSRDYDYLQYEEDDDTDLDASAYGVTSSNRPEALSQTVTSSAGPHVIPEVKSGMMTSSNRPEARRRPLVVDIYSVSDSQRRRHDTAHHAIYRPVAPPDDEYYDPYDVRDYYSSQQMTSYVGQGQPPRSQGHETSLGLKETANVGATTSGSVFTIATVVVVAVTMVALR